MLLSGVALVSFLVVALAAARWWRSSGDEGELTVAAQPAESFDTTIPEIPNPETLDPLVAEAVTRAVEKVRRSPSSGEAYGELGRLYHSHEFDDLARRCYTIAHRLAPGTADWPYYLGVLADEAGRHEEAVELFRSALRIRPEDRAATLRLGNALLAAARLDEADEVFRVLVAGAPAEPWGYLGLGKVARRRARLEKAAEHLEEAVRLDPNSREASYLLAMTYGELGRQEESVRLAQELRSDLPQSWPEDPLMVRLQRERRDMQTLIKKGNLLLDQGAADAAEALYRMVLATDPKHFDAHFNLAVLLQRRGQSGAAEEEIRAAIATRPDSALAHYARAVLLGEQGRFEEAAGELEATLLFDPEHDDARRLLEALRSGVPADRRP